MVLTGLWILLQAAGSAPAMPPKHERVFDYHFDKAFFDRADSNKDGILDLAEFRTEIRKMMDASLAAHPDARAKLDDAKERQLADGFDTFFRGADANSDGRISLSEFADSQKVTPAPSSRDSKDQLTISFAIDADFFKDSDTDGNGTLSWPEFRAAFRKRIDRSLDANPEQKAKATEEKINGALDSLVAMFRAMDANSDGQLTLEEARKSRAPD